MKQAAVQISYPAGAVATVQNTSDIDGDTAFPGIATGMNFPNPAAFVAESTSGPGVTGTLVAPNTYDLFLGTFTFTAGAMPGSETITASSHAVFHTVTSTSQTLTVSSTTATIDVAQEAVAVPEPANVLTALAGAIGAAGWMGWAWARRRSQGVNAER